MLDEVYHIANKALSTISERELLCIAIWPVIPMSILYIVGAKLFLHPLNRSMQMLTNLYSGILAIVLLLSVVSVLFWPLLKGFLLSYF